MVARITVLHPPETSAGLCFAFGIHPGRDQDSHRIRMNDVCCGNKTCPFSGFAPVSTRARMAILETKYALVSIRHLPVALTKGP